jgi:hypothetical protein
MVHWFGVWLLWPILSKTTSLLKATVLGPARVRIHTNLFGACEMTTTLCCECHVVTWGHYCNYCDLYIYTPSDDKPLPLHRMPDFWTKQFVPNTWFHDIPLHGGFPGVFLAPCRNHTLSGRRRPTMPAPKKNPKFFFRRGCLPKIVLVRHLLPGRFEAQLVAYVTLWIPMQSYLYMFLACLFSKEWGILEMGDP